MEEKTLKYRLRGELMEQRRNNIIATVFMFLLMILAAIAENTRGIFVPSFKENFSINDTQIGVMLTMTSIGYMVATYFGGALCQKIGQKKVFIIGIIFMIGSLGLLSMSSTYYLFLISMGLVSCGLALTSIAINTIVPILFVSMQTLIMNLVHFCYGLGSAVGQRTAGVLVYKGVDWRVIYMVVALAYVVMLVCFIFIKIPEPPKAKEEKMSIFNAGYNKIIIFYMIALGFYMFAEIGTGNWFLNYMEKTYSFDKGSSSFYVALFFGIFTIGRLLGGFVVERFGYINVVIKSLITALIIYTIGLFMGQSGVTIIAISGLFFSIAFPTIVSTISKVFGKNSAYITGLIITAGSVINMIMNMIMGVANDNLGTRIAFFLIPISLVISITALLFVHHNTKNVLQIKRN